MKSFFFGFTPVIGGNEMKYNNLLECIKKENLLEVMENITFSSFCKCLNILLPI